MSNKKIKFKDAATIWWVSWLTVLTSCTQPTKINFVHVDYSSQVTKWVYCIIECFSS
jgi:hypothetical protein